MPFTVARPCGRALTIGSGRRPVLDMARSLSLGGDFAHLIPSGTVTACPYKGTTSGYWSVRAGATVHADLAWSYDFPTRQLLPIAGMIAFYNEKVDTIVDGQRLDRPQTHFFPKPHGS